MTATDGTAPTGARTLLRGLAILEALAATDGPIGVSELALVVALDKATTSRLLQTLVSAGYVRQGQDRRFELTSKIVRVAGRVVVERDLRTVARPHLEALRDLTDETVHLGHLESDSVVYIEKLETTRSVRLVSAVGQTMPLYTTALGKALLSALPAAERPAVVERLGIEAAGPRTERTVRTSADFLADLEVIATRGYSIDDRENEDDITCLGAPIVDHTGRAANAISVSGPSFRVHPCLAELGAAVKKTAAAISAELGAAPPADVGRLSGPGSARTRGR